MVLKAHFQCRRCGRCCKRLGVPWPWQLSKLDAIAEFLKISKADLISRYYGDFVTAEREISDKSDRRRRKPCPFLGKDGSCQIYPVRPIECEAHPFDIDSSKSSTFDSFIGIDCPALEE